MALACNLGAIQAADLPRYHALVKRLRASVEEIEELDDGYSFRLDMPVADVEEWARLERLCCLSLRGGDVAKAIVGAELLLSRRSEA